MPSVSRNQQSAMGAALAVKRGKLPASKLKNKNLLKMSESELEEFASTKRKGLPKQKGKG